MWGQHVALDLRACDRATVTDAAALRAWVTDLVARIGMRPHGRPLVEHFAGHDLDVGGYSLVQLIETSNICGHFVDCNGDAYIDVFSCAPFDPDVVVAFVNETLSPEATTVHHLIRDARSPTSGNDDRHARARSR
jgi:S-adenosylmethionine/arginine decarboxylase-like enzyme